MTKVQVQRAEDVRINYNGMEFNSPLTNVWLGGAPVTDRSGRVTQYVQYTLHIVGVITYDRGGGTAAFSASNSPQKSEGLKGPTEPSGGVGRLRNSERADQRIGRNTGILGNGATDTVRNRLLQQGGALICSGYGFGDIFVNTSGDGRSGVENLDVVWGPVPENVVVRPIGGPNTVMEVSMTIRFCIGECWGGRPLGPGRNVVRLREFSYAIRYSIDQTGHTSRTLTGTLSIAANRKPVNSIDADRPANQPNAELDGSVDRARDYITALMGQSFTLPPAGFIRQSQDYAIDESHSSISFSITDSEVPSDNAYPPGIASAVVTHRASLSRSNAKFSRVINTISGSMTAAAGYARWHAWTRAYLLIRQRILEGRRDPITFAVLTDLEIVENIYGKNVDFSVSWTLTYLPELAKVARPRRGNPGVGEMIGDVAEGAVRINIPIPNRDIAGNAFGEGFIGGDPGEGDRKRKELEIGTSFFSYANFYSSNGLFKGTGDKWNDWQESMQFNLSARGNRRLIYDSSQETFYSLCNPAVGTDIDGGARELTAGPRVYLGEIGSLSCNCPPANRSYLDYRQSVTDRSSGKILQIDSLPGDPLNVTNDPKDGTYRNSTGTEYEYPSTRSYTDYDGSVKSESVAPGTQKRATIRFGPDEGDIWLVGYAERLCYNVQIPKLANVLTIDGETYAIDKSAQDSHVVRRWQSGSLGGCPVYRATWAFKLKKTNAGGINRDEAIIVDDSGIPLGPEPINVEDVDERGFLTPP